MQTQPQPSRRRTTEEWTSMVTAWRQSGRPAKDFAKEAGVAPKSLAWWAWKLGASSPGLTTTERKPKASEAPAFRPVRVLDATSGSSSSIAIKHDSGFTVSISGPVDGSVLRSILQAVRTC